MSTSESIDALRRANPRTDAGFAASVAATEEAVRSEISGAAPATPQRSSTPRRLLAASALGASLAAVALVAVMVTGGSPRRSAGVENAAAAVAKAATLTAASAQRSGTAVVRITHDGTLWAGSTVRWHADDLSVKSEAPQRRGRAGSWLLLVDGTMYGIEDGVWVELGSPKSIDPGSGTTPGDYLAAVREDLGGATLHRLTAGMTGLTTSRRGDGSIVYSGTVAAGLVARESAFKEGERIRVLPFGYVARGEAADPSSLLDAAVTVDVDGIVREISVAWGAGASSWRYTVTYGGLGATAPLIAPANARPLRERRAGG
jgi:hypothetical protein